ncbi:hypothetical protein QBC46DRAFT_372720 [Diplogelasinospora grovesii]|uniref:Uncharacterized protein n=1 Tax=Diplogelasinospora grovesii TaxID=303347 RepID=A0AAN6NGH9_9PEZI|nr:hypothetical protein QBC46DRAFT_372720 [Diplogelasinospora grovesii]
MTNQARGSSLVQARKKNHNHHHLHSHHHVRYQQKPEGSETDIRSTSEDKKVQDREVVVVQTVSVVQVIDATGAPIGVSTIHSDSVTQSPKRTAAGVTLAVSALGNILPSVSLAGPAVGDGTPSSTGSAKSGSASLTAPLSSLSSTLTSVPFTSTTGFPTLSAGVYNSSASRPPPLFSNSTLVHSLFTNSTTSSSFSLSTSTSYSSSSGSQSTSTWVPAATVGGAGGDGNAGADGATGTASVATATSTPTTSSGLGLTPAAQSAVIGGVVGGVAGIALIAFVLMFLLKWKKQQVRGIMLLGDGDSTAKGRGPSSGPGSGGGGMTERSIPFAVPSALASLTGQKRAIEGPSEESGAQEKGFYRVSGKKLLSVLESGGDGYSDPHASVMSTNSYYRDSQAFSGGPSTPRLQLGSPMRPESGVPIMRSGPARRAVQEQVPYSDSLAPPPTDPPGRPLVSRHSSQGSGSPSRFAEDLMA